jgi:hypothetical protein
VEPLFAVMALLRGCLFVFGFFAEFILSKLIISALLLAILFYLHNFFLLRGIDCIKQFYASVDYRFRRGGQPV